MTKAPVSEQSFTAKQIAEMASSFLESDFGKLYLGYLNTQYNVLHQSAEADDLDVNRKAMKVERAAGVRFGIDWLTGKDKLLKTGYYDEKEAPAEQ